MRKKRWYVAQCNNLTAYDTFDEETFEGPTNIEDDREWFDTEEEALEYYRKQKAMLRFAGGPGMYYTYPREEKEED